MIEFSVAPVRTRQHGNADVFYSYSSAKSTLTVNLPKLANWSLSIHIAENAVTMIMTTALLCFKGFFAA